MNFYISSPFYSLLMNLEKNFFSSTRDMTLSSTTYSIILFIYPVYLNHHLSVLSNPVNKKQQKTTAEQQYI